MIVAVVSAAVPLLVNGLGNVLSSDSHPKCPGAACAGKNPNTEGCGVDALTYQPGPDNPVYLQVRYSKRCGAAWGRITNGEVGDDVTIAVDGGGTSEAVITSYHDMYTNMVTVGRTFRVKVCAHPTVNPEASVRWKAYCIEAVDTTEWKP